MGVASSSMPAESELETRARNIPAEILEEILLHLPAKSLLRFSTVSKAWQSVIFDARFVQRQRICSRAVMIATFLTPYGSGASTRPLSSIYPNHMIGTGDGEPLICPFGRSPRVLASCGDLWCAEYNDSLFLWNPSMRTFRKLPYSPRTRPHHVLFYSDFCFGVGYDLVADDYKILKFRFRGFNAGGQFPEHDEVYSLRSDSWKQTEPFPGVIDWHRGRGGVAASGAIYWLARRPHDEHERVIISFDLSAEKYTEVPMPQHGYNYNYGAVLSVFKGKLCAALKEYTSQGSLDVYLMQEYGVGESWAKIFELHIAPFTAYLSDHGSGVIALRWLSADHHASRTSTLICADEESMELQRVFHCFNDYTCHLYVETLISPQTYCGRRKRNHLAFVLVCCVGFLLCFLIVLPSFLELIFLHH